MNSMSMLMSTVSATTTSPAPKPRWMSTPNSAFWLAMLLPGNGGFHRNPPGTTEAQGAHLLALLS